MEYLLSIWQQLLYVSLSGFLYYFFNEMEDESIKSNWKFNQQWLNTSLSWKNKWKLSAGGHIIPYEGHWYHFGIKPSSEERFAYSSTILVFVTDGEHLFQFLKNIFILFAVYFASENIYIVGAFLVGKLFSSLIKEAFLKRWLT
jgi:hypothetical protein